MPEISTLPSITTLVPDTDVLAIVSDGDTKKISPTAAPGAAPNVLATDANGSIAFDTDVLVVDAVNDKISVGGAIVLENGEEIGNATDGIITLGGAVAEGTQTVASGFSSHAEGLASIASGMYSHAEGNAATAGGDYSHAEGNGTIAVGEKSHAEGSSTTANGTGSHAEGNSSTATGFYSHAEGYGTLTTGYYSYAGGRYSIARDYCQSTRAGGRFSANGDAQSSLFVAFEDITHSDANWHSLYLNGSSASELIHIPADTLWTVNILIAGTTQGCTQSFSYQIVGAVENDGGTTTVLAQTVTTLHEDDADFAAQIAADDANDALLVQVQDSTSGNATVRWVATVRTVEVSYPA